jgi:hypothetical protein
VRTRARARVPIRRLGARVSGASVLRAGAAWAASVLAQRHAAYLEEKICFVRDYNYEYETEPPSEPSRSAGPATAGGRDPL